MSGVKGFGQHQAWRNEAKRASHRRERMNRKKNLDDAEPRNPDTWSYGFWARCEEQRRRRRHNERCEAMFGVRFSFELPESEQYSEKVEQEKKRVRKLRRQNRRDDRQRKREGGMMS